MTTTSLRWTLTLALTACLCAPLRADDPPPAPAGEDEGKGKKEGKGKEPGKDDPGRGRGKDDKPSRKAVLRAYLDELEGQRQVLAQGELEITVVAIPDAFVHRMVVELLATDGLNDRGVEALREQVARLAEERKGSMGKPAVLVRFGAAGGGNELYGFTGQLDDILRVRADGKSQRVSVGDTQGEPPQVRSYTLFKASRSGAFGGGNVSPTWRTQITVLSRKAFALELVLSKPLPEKAKELDLAMANLIHFSGVGGNATQMDFEKGASAEFVPPAKVEFPLPLRAPAMPPEVRELMPEWKGD